MRQRAGGESTGWHCCCVKRCDWTWAPGSTCPLLCPESERPVPLQLERGEVWKPELGRLVGISPASHGVFYHRTTARRSDDTRRAATLRLLLGAGLLLPLLSVPAQPSPIKPRLTTGATALPPSWNSPNPPRLAPLRPPGNQGGGRAGVPSLALAVTPMTSPCRIWASLGLVGLHFPQRASARISGGRVAGGIWLAPSGFAAKRRGSPETGREDRLSYSAWQACAAVARRSDNQVCRLVVRSTGNSCNRLVQ